MYCTVLYVTSQASKAALRTSSALREASRAIVGGPKERKRYGRGKRRRKKDEGQEKERKERETKKQKIEMKMR